MNAENKTRLSLIIWIWALIAIGGVMGAMDILVSTLIFLTYPKIRTVSLLMFPYLLWILFASYLNFYIWLYN